jgi:hypothetical protein
MLTRLTIVTFSIGDNVLGLSELQALRLVEGLAATAARSPASQALATRIGDAASDRDAALAGAESELSLTDKEQDELLLALERFEWSAEWETALTNLRAALREEQVPRPTAGERP